MINKQGLWFLTLFSLILVLSVYYITMPSEVLKMSNSNYVGSTEKEEPTINIEESELLEALRVDKEEERTNLKKELESKLTNKDITSQEKNEAYEELKSLNTIAGEESNIETLIKKNYGTDSFVKINGNEIKIVIIKDKHDTALANSIMRLVQTQYQDKKFITVKFESS